MTLNELRYVVALAQTGHFGRAAEKCFVSQPTLSVAIKKLEDDLGVTLFERTRTRVWPTPAGKRIINQANRVLDEAQVIRELASEAKDPLAIPLRVGAIFTIGPYLFPHALPELQRLAPKMSLYVEENFTAVLREKLRHGELDVIIISLPFTEPDGVTQPIYDEPFVVLLAADHPLAAKETVTPADLQQENVLLLGEGHCFRDQVLSLCPGLGHESEPRRAGVQNVEGSSLETLKYMVATGLGITVLPLSAADVAHYAQGLLVTRPFSIPEAVRTVALAWRTSFPRHQAIDVLNQAIRACRFTPTDVEC